MGRVVRDIGMTMLVALVVHTLYAARHTRGRPTPPPPAASVYASPPPPLPPAAQAASQFAEEPPVGFSVFPWAP